MIHKLPAGQTVYVGFLVASQFLISSFVSVSLADGPQDNSVESVRPVPPPGIELSEEQRQALATQLSKVKVAFSELQSSKNTRTQELLPDVEVLIRAVHEALSLNSFYQERDLKNAHQLLDLASERIVELQNGTASWTTAKGQVIRGFRSGLDGTVQPYGLEIADNYDTQHIVPARCDIWFHGRGERSLELQFLSQRLRQPGQYPPETGIVLHPFGRYSNAFKFAGEVDVLEALEHVKQEYSIDPDRISVRGFSMGGAACWQFAVHYADQWFAANPGAGFSETPDFLKTFQGETLNPPWYEEKLWRMYDCNLVAKNLMQVPTIAYSGEIDRQKQAADIMEAACEAVGIDLVHVIGPDTEHKIHPDSNQLMRVALDSLAEHGRERFPNQVHLTTYTLKYNRMGWLSLLGLKEHWEKSTIDGQYEIDSKQNASQINIETSGVTEFQIDFPPGWSPFQQGSEVSIVIDGQSLPTTHPRSDWSFSSCYRLDGDQWTNVTPDETSSAKHSTTISKQPGLQGPIDDAFMSPFLFVLPTGTDENASVEEWVKEESEHAIHEWRRQMRGDVRIRKDVDVTEEDYAQYNLILWGTPNSNSLISELMPQLPIGWGESGIQIGDESYAAAEHALTMIAPNPKNPSRYIVLNSGFTYREYDYLNNARQTPKLPDWAVIDTRTKPNARWPGQIVAADFFDEQWSLKKGD
ncbi:prolyl oligopeptidase family serine peptidase [Thalassoglobus sp. JC818]|uniref:prolyl oligopeptidase family serine peptidase n=1 Tax=Thalassoglobus sp. JC818 TaxID=3232136 RepID=UPI003459628D